MLVQCWYKKLRIAIYRHFKQLFAAGQRLPWQIKSTLIILKILPVRARFAAQCRTLRRALSRHILSKTIGRNAEMANRGKTRQIEDVIRSKIVVEIGVFYYRCPFVTLGDLECRWIEASYVSSLFFSFSSKYSSICFTSISVSFPHCLIASRYSPIVNFEYILFISTQ